LMDDNNIIAEFLPLESTRKSILEDPDLLKRIVDAWQSLTIDALVHNPLESGSGGEPASFTDAVPDEYRELTETIIYWCDAHPKYSIDPAALSDLLSYMLDADVLLSDGVTREDVLDAVENDYGTFNGLFNRAINVTDRIIWVTSTRASGLGRPRSSDVTKRREKVKKCLERGMKPGEIAMEIGESVINVKQDKVRILKAEKQGPKSKKQQNKKKK
jgi:hypothetical protein